MRQRGRPRHPDVLTPREQEVLVLIRDGLTNEQIAERLNIGFETAKSHVSEILSKLGVATREEASAWQSEAERRWSFGRIVLAIAGTAVVAAAVAGLALLAWGLSRSGGDGGSTPATTGSSTSTPAAQTSSLFPDSVWRAGAASGWLAGVEKACADGSAVCGGLILHTNDSGGSWDEQYRGQVQVSKIAFDGDQRGFAIGPTQQCSGNAPCPSGILRTADGGLHWQEVTTTPLHLTGIGLAAGDAWLIGQQCPPDQPSSACGWYLLDSANRGDTWTQSTLPISGFALDLSRPTANDAWIVTSPSGPGTAQLIVTHDAGQTWQDLPGPPDGLSLEQRIFFRTTSEGWLLVG
jgi:DNA-binding CsgD family transcriptional regulator